MKVTSQREHTLLSWGAEARPSGIRKSFRLTPSVWRSIIYHITETPEKLFKGRFSQTDDIDQIGDR